MPAFCESLFLYLDNYFGSYPLKTTNKAKITENQQKLQCTTQFLWPHCLKMFAQFYWIYRLDENE